MDHAHNAVASADSGTFFTDLLYDYVPRQQCMYHQPDLIGLHIISDSLIALAYFSIPIALVYFAQRRQDLAFNWMFLLFALFIVLCGTTHIFNVIAMWHAYYRLDGLVKAATAIASVGTAIALWKLMPHALSLPGIAEIKKRKDELETLVMQRTSELTEINRALRQEKDRAEAANQAKTNFLANMSHEIRTPMNAIVGLTDLMRRGNISGEQQTLFFKTMETSATQLLGLINDLLDISKIENKNLALDEKDFSLYELIEEVRSINAVQASERNIALTNEFECDKKLYVAGDPLRLRQILSNIVGNAIKFTEHGTVTVRTRCTENTRGQANITIDVIDTGIGIPADKLQAIFNEFYQGDASITRKYGGTGLGLSISKTLLDLMGGTISVTSTPGEGSRFTIALSLPRKSDKQETDAAPDKDARHEMTKKNAKARILIVEDNPANTLVASSMLEILNYDSLSAPNGREAVERLDSEHFDAVLMDIQMPDMDGFAVTRHIRESEKTSGAHIPIIGITAHAMVGDREKCLAAGMDDYLSKPFRMESLRMTLERLLRLNTTMP